MKAQFMKIHQKNRKEVSCVFLQSLHQFVAIYIFILHLCQKLKFLQDNFKVYTFIFKEKII